MPFPDGRPVGLNRVTDEEGVNTRRLHVWTGKSWRSQQVPIDGILQPTREEWVGFRSRDGRVERFTSHDEGSHWTSGSIVLETDGEQKLNTQIAHAHQDAMLVIYDRVDDNRIPGKQRLWVWGVEGFLKKK